MPKNYGLGRGLKSLIPSQPDKIKKILKEPPDFLVTEEKVLQVSPNKIQPNPHQPRQNIEHQGLEELIESIKTYGIIQPLVVIKTDNGYQLIAGERRLRAAQILELDKVPVIIRKAKDIEQLELSLIENIQRKDLNPIEKALAYQKLIDEFNLTQKEVAQRIGKSRASVSNALRLLTLPEEIQRALVEGKITEGHAKAILASEKPVQQLKLYRKILLGNLTVREIERQVRRRHRKSLFLERDLELVEQENRLRQALGTKVKIQKKGERGKVIIEYYSPEELDRIIKKICQKQ